MGRRWLLAGAGLLVVLGLAVAVAWWINSWRSVEILDASRESVLILTARPGDGWPVGITGVSLWVTGEIDGEAEVWAGNWEPQRLSGRVDWRVYHDWFEPDCRLHYQPRGTTSGKLVVRYKLH